MAEDKQQSDMPDTDEIGPFNLTSKEEQSILLKVHLMVRIGFPVRSKHLLDSVQRIMIKEKRKNDFVDNRPGQEWLSKIYKKHPRIRQALEDITKVYLRTYNVFEWFDNAKDFMQKQDEFRLVRDGTRFWVFDLMEFGFIKETGHYTLDTTLKKNVTTLATTFGATGEVGPKMLIYNDTERFYQKFIKEFPSNWMLKMSPFAQLTESIFEAYILVFKKYLQEQEIEPPVLLLVNSQKIPFTLEIGDFCRMRGIILYASYLNSPNVYQPVEGDLMYLIKQLWNGIVNTRYAHKILKKSQFLTLIQEVFGMLAPVTVRNAFRANGFFPWRPRLIDSECTPSKGRKKKSKKKSKSIQSDKGNYSALYMPPQVQPKVTPMEFLPVSMEDEKLELFDCPFEENSLSLGNTTEQGDSLDPEYPPVQPMMFVKVEALDIDEDGVANEVVEEEEGEEEDISGMCRVCGGTMGIMLQIFSLEGQQAKLQQKIKKFLDIDVEETEAEWPRQVCHFCVSGLDACQRLADTAQETDRKLRDVVNSKILKKMQQEIHCDIPQECSSSTCSDEISTKVEYEPDIDLLDEPLNQYVVTDENFSSRDNIANRIDEIINTNEQAIHNAKVEFVPKFTLIALPTNQRKESEENMDTSSPLPSTSRQSEPCENEKRKSQNVYVYKKFYTKETDISHLTCGLCHETFPEIHNIKAHYKITHDLYFCRYCYINFKTSNELKTHESVHFIKCKYCNENTRSGRYFRAHVREMHAEELPTHLNFKHESYRVQCKLCDIITATSIGAKTHYFWEHRKEMCEICFELFDTKSDFQLHINEVHIITCKYCSEISYTYLRYKRHVSKYHNVKDDEEEKIDINLPASNELYCKLCNKIMKSKLSLKRHNYWSHNKYTCYICLNTFKTPELEEKHYKSHGNMCIECNCQMKSAEMLTEHYKNDHENLKPFMCEFCGDSFKTRHELNVHRPSHTPSKEHLCDQCGKGFKTSTLLSQHKYIHKPLSEKNKVWCPYCERRFTFFSQLKFHMTIHTDEKLYKCNDCNIQFKNSNELRIHMKTHEVIYDCELCMMKFKLKNNLDAHIKCIHDSDFIYKCNQCPRLYTNERDIDIHVTCHSQLDEDTCGYILTQGFYCDFCDAICSSKKFIKSHIKKMHLNDLIMN